MESSSVCNQTSHLFIMSDYRPTWTTQSLTVTDVELERQTRIPKGNVAATIDIDYFTDRTITEYQSDGETVIYLMEAARVIYSRVKIIENQ